MFDILYTLVGGEKERISYFKNNRELDFGYSHTGGESYRGNAYMFMGKIAIALRRIPEKVKSLMEIDMPKSIGKVLQAKQGLFLITGPAGSGKSTTMNSMLEAINEVRSDFIVTIEDPIEYIFKNHKSTFAQREVGRDTLSFANAVKSAMRENADIIVIGEIRDRETMEIALALAETGHLVFSTLHTAGSVQTISRIIQFFAPEIEVQIRTRISESLIGVLSQRLIPRRD
jgi:twitching motility protein PilT